MVISYPGSTKIEQEDVKGKKEKEKKRNHGFVNSWEDLSGVVYNSFFFKSIISES